MDGIRKMKKIVPKKPKETSGLRVTKKAYNKIRNISILKDKTLVDTVDLIVQSYSKQVLNSNRVKKKPNLTRLNINQCINCLYTDLLMLQEENWIPDEHSVNASLNVIIELAGVLKVNLKDTRDETTN